MATLAELRAQVRARQRAVGKKISRLRSQGVELGGTKNDPRRNSELYKRYTRKQLETQLARLNAFQSRSNSFYALGNGQVVTGAQVQKYRRAEAAVNRSRRRLFEIYSGRKIGGKTLEERIADATPKDSRLINPAINHNWKPIKRNLKGIRSVEAMEKLRLKLLRQAEPEYLQKQAVEGRNTARELLEYAGQDDVLDAIDTLSKDEWQELWLTPGFAREASIAYENTKRYEYPKLREKEAHGLQSMAQDSRSTMMDMINDVKKRRK